MTLNAKIGGFMDFLAISSCDTSLYHSQGGATVLSLCALRCIVSTIIYYLVHFWCTVFGETACIGLSYSVICDILFDGAATSGISLQRPALTNANWLHWLSYIFTRESSYCFHRVFAIAILSIRPSHGWINQKWCKLGLPNFHRRLHGTIVMRSR